MSKRNGPITLGDLSVELVPAVEVIRDGEPVVLRGYRDGLRCPGRIKAAVAAARRAYNDLTQTTVTTMVDGVETPTIEYQRDELAYARLCADLLLTVVVGLEDAEADVLSGDPDKVMAVLRYLDWAATPDDAETDEADDDPEVPALSPTTESSSQSSALSTTSRRKAS